MIEYNEQSRIFHLTNGSISYMIYRNACDILETLYFGRAMKTIIDPSAMRKSAEWHDSSFYYDNVEKKEYRYADGFKNNSTPVEIGTHGLFDKRYAPLIIQRQNGS